MGVRITTSMLFRTALANVARQRARLAETQEQASSGLRINRPSDDPVGVQNALPLRAARESAEQFLRNADTALGRLRATEGALQDALDVLQDARVAAVAGANAEDAENRQIRAREVATLHERMVTTANSRHTDGYLFSGFRNDTQAFSASGPFVSGGAPPAVTFNGDSNEIQAEVEEGVTIPTTLDGRRVFQGDGDGDGNPDAGREDVFDVLASLWQALDTNDQTAVQNTLDRISRAESQIRLELTRVGTIERRVEAAEDAHQSAVVDLTERLSQVEDADTIRVLSDLVSQETALEASLEAASRLIQPSLLDFLR